MLLQLDYLIRRSSGSELRNKGIFPVGEIHGPTY